MSINAESGHGDAPTAAEFWNIRDIQFHCRIGRSTAWRLVREDGFPAPILYGKRCVLWPRAEIMEFLEARRDPSHYEAQARLQRLPAQPSSAFATRPVRRRSA
jgi:predicted DNA-binding transcriptional regulator AlpA